LAIIILEEVVQPYVQELDQVLEKPSLNHDEKCNFVKLCTMSQFVVTGIAAFVIMGFPDDPGDPCTQWGEPLPGAMDDLPMVRTGIPLASPDDRWARVVKFKKTVSELAHQAATKVSLFEDNIKCVQSIVALISSLLLDYACETAVHDYHNDNYKFVQDMCRISKSQQEYPRVYWIRRAQWAHFTRLQSLKLLFTQRSSVDDKLIIDLTEFSVSSWLSIRRSAQKVLDAVCNLYDGSRNLVSPILFESLKPGSDPGRMKGAMYVLASKTFLKFCMADDRLCSTFYLSMLRCQHSDKSSVQSLVSNLLSQSIIRQQEFSTWKSTIRIGGTNDLINSLNSELTRCSMDPEICKILDSRRSNRVQNRNASSHKLVDDLLDIAKATSTHWKYSLHANRLLSSMVRRDEPINATVATHFVNELMNSELPSKRTYSISAITKMLHFVKLRTFIESDEDLLTRKSYNPLRMIVDFPSPQDHEQFQKFLTGLQRPLNDHPDYLLDRLQTGWLICGSEKVHKPPDETVGTTWEGSSAPTLDALKEIMLQGTFWERIAAHMSQEHTRNYLLPENVILLSGCFFHHNSSVLDELISCSYSYSETIFQIFGIELWSSLLPTLEELLADPEDRHKQRAAAEIISGVIRGTKHVSISIQLLFRDHLVH